MRLMCLQRVDQTDTESASARCLISRRPNASLPEAPTMINARFLLFLGSTNWPLGRCSIPESAHRPRAVHCRVFGKGNVEDIEPIMPAEDFSFFLQKVPGAFVFVGHEDPAAGPSAALHNPNFRLNEAVLPLGATLLADIATEFLQRGGIHGAAVESAAGRDEL